MAKLSELKTLLAKAGRSAPATIGKPPRASQRPSRTPAGDDVDVCWRLQEEGFTIGFCAAAVVYHHRRNSIGAFWRQQSGYGNAEALLAAKWPGKYNILDHINWAGRIYSHGPGIPGLFRNRVYYGVCGSAPFQ